jgi:hypothetical protein
MPPIRNPERMKKRSTPVPVNRKADLEISPVTAGDGPPRIYEIMAEQDEEIATPRKPSSSGIRFDEYSNCTCHLIA